MPQKVQTHHVMAIIRNLSVEPCDEHLKNIDTAKYFTNITPIQRSFKRFAIQISIIIKYFYVNQLHLVWF